MFEKEAEEYVIREDVITENDRVPFDNGYGFQTVSFEDEVKKGFQDGAEFGYNKAKEDVKHDLMMKLKNEGIVKPLKSSILRNERLSSQEQQELCAWIECAMDFGENLDECAKELEEANKANEWHYVKDGKYPIDEKDVEVLYRDCDKINVYNCIYDIHAENWLYYNLDNMVLELFPFIVIAWKEIVLP